MRPTPWTRVVLALGMNSVAAQKVDVVEAIIQFDPSTVVQFDSLIGSSGAPEAFPILVAGKQGQQQSWTVKDGFTIDRVELFNASAAIAQWLNEGNKLNNLQVTLNQTGGRLDFDISRDPDQQYYWQGNFEKPLFVNISWSGKDRLGFSATGAFAVAREPGLVASQQASASLSAALASDTALPTTPVASITATVINTGVPASTGGVTTTAPTGSAAGGSNPTAQAPPNGLSNGAIAGIAVGGAAALAIVGVLVWFFCFRRRKQQGPARGAEYGHDAGTHAMIIDKEVPGVSESSPHSAYGDDGGRLHDRGSTAMDSHYAPYSDQAPSAHASPAVANAMTSSQTHLPYGTSSPVPPATTQYAHLVEEGMTPDEIRRLEEEERALDQAIEAAGSNRAPR
ncbi:uncharacterized protein B0I36DRAFT_352199 [Microdochium trichocladiopsis]|uniref:Uncharacterized protein n=1 Tax=Microdochium trichocladiopsis TaxID=1682393 RepID=A0A9P8Y366_9PEZI|nr:uncharacterized protein B0I36DRAFT_352199 [Microdochium trichocladiopsis]KAH7026318.1 hypothetical protein B0I36DRAFT_352199 [Microdochium trichocladiopsis]